MIKRCDRHGNLSLQKTEGFYKHKLIMAEILVNSTDPIQIECFWPDTVKQDFHAMFSIVLKIYRYQGNGSSGGVTTIINIINNGQGNITVGDINVNSLKGTASAEALSGRSGNDFENDVIDGMGGNDVLTGYRGADQLNGGVGNDEVRAGNGKDILTGGEGMDELYGGFGMNTFTGEQDGYADDLYLKSDHLAVNWLTNTANNNPNGYKTDEIGALDSYDKIHIQGAMDSQLSFMDTSHVRGDGTELDGIGIYASGSLEAVYTGGNLSVQQVMSMTSGVAA